ncbi:MAG: TIGR04283 family arsenosugar biosynthesis glycosyltransferase [Candidatus Hydrogenedentes bacterium]|nr:TIGR04283 family arsenosugar biosynthesis glycosyltransferase [Candidatus Hydrogenedentota bacterium]
MREQHRIAVIIPALNEAASIAQVIAEIPPWADEIIVADNGSTDATASVAAAAGAKVVHESRRGYGSACLCAMAQLNNPDIVVFLDGDYSDYPGEMALLVDPILAGEVDLVIGSRMRGEHERGALTPQAAFGNGLATRLIRLFWGVTYTDLGPFRAIRYSTLLALGMRDPGYGWTVEMQIRAALQRVPATEVPVRYRKRIGISKVSGTVRGVLGAGYKILGTIAVAALFANAMPRDRRLVLFSRWPEAGATKTRLIPALGAEGAAQLQRAMTAHILSAAAPADGRTSVEIRFTGCDRGVMRDWLGAEYDYADQGTGDLGARMARAFAENFDLGCDKVVIIGADCPALTSMRSAEAFNALSSADLVLGPALDGGYYLIGMRIDAAVCAKALLANVDWGSACVLQQTLDNAAAAGLSCAQLEAAADIDLPEDLPAWEEARARQRISVILPVLNEAACIASALDRLQHLENVEILVVDGGSTDGTLAEAQRFAGVRVLQSERGRAQQMNAGAAQATGKILLFLHADTTLPRNWPDQVRRTVAYADVSLGAFQFQVDGTGAAYRFIEWGARLRSRRLRLPYGDQAFFMTRSVFEAAGGFPLLPIMEDAGMVRRCRSLGRIHVLDAPALTSARRWQHHGRWRVSLKNALALLMYALGAPPAWIARCYGPRTEQ